MRDNMNYTSPLNTVLSECVEKSVLRIRGSVNGIFPPLFFGIVTLVIALLLGEKNAIDINYYAVKYFFACKILLE